MPSDVQITCDAATDLHMHTIHSDGHWTPDALFAYLAAEQFRVVAVTDHDTFAHIEEVRSLGEARGITVLAGVEVTSRWREMIAHVLCYARWFRGDALGALVEQTRLGQLENTQEVYAELERRGYQFPRRDKVLAVQNGRLLRPIDNARLLIEHGYVADVPAALDVLRDAGYRIIAAPIAQTFAAAHADGAVTVLAHPGRGGGEIQRYEPATIEAMLAELPAGLDGIEVSYPLHTNEQVDAYRTLAARHGLLVSAGSDSHGPRQRFPIAYHAEQCSELLARCGITVNQRQS